MPRDDRNAMLPLKSQVASVEKCRKLATLGFPTTTLYLWYNSITEGEYVVVSNHFRSGFSVPPLPAYTVAELCQLLREHQVEMEFNFAHCDSAAEELADGIIRACQIGLIPSARTGVLL